MTFSFQSFKRAKALKCFASTVKTGLIPLSEIKTAMTFLDASSRSFEECRSAVSDFYRKNGIDGNFLYLDLRNFSRKVTLKTAPQRTITLKDLNWYGKVRTDKLTPILRCNSDLFISLVNSKDYPVHFLTSAYNARLKIGRQDYSGGVPDVVISDFWGNRMSETECFSLIEDYLHKIK